VIAASQNDFEEFGVDQSTLDEMKQVCDSLAAPGYYPFPAVTAVRSRAVLSFVVLSFQSITVGFVGLSSARSSTVQRCSLAWVVMGGRKRG
jgi:hypothetical protein